VISNSPSRPHDIDTFKASDSVMNEHATNELFYRLEGFADYYYYESQAIRLHKYLYFFNYASNKYICKILQDSAERMLNALTAVHEYMHSGKFVLITNEREDTKCKLWPAYQVIDEMGIDQEMRDKQFNEYWDILRSRVQYARSSYYVYRSKIREILFL
jgi:hypothetical protein